MVNTCLKLTSYHTFVSYLIAKVLQLLRSILSELSLFIILDFDTLLE